MFIKPNTISFALVLSLLFTPVFLHASTYDDDILNIFSKILPRFILMSSQKNRVKNDIEICVLHDSVDKRVAQSLIKKIDKNYPNGIKDYPIKLVRDKYSHIDSCQNSQLVFMFDSADSNIKKALSYSYKHSLLSVSYDKKLLEDGVNVSLFLGRKVTPYINTESLRNDAIKIDNVLLRISKIYDGDGR